MKRGQVFLARHYKKSSEKWVRRQILIAVSAVAISTIGPVVAVLLTNYQVERAAEIQREGIARGQWMEYIKSNISHPDFSCPKDSGAAFVKTLALENHPSKADQFEEYTVFSFSVFENILDFLANENREVWNDVIRSRLSCYEAYLYSKYFLEDGYCSYSDSLLKLVDEKLERKGIAKPVCTKGTTAGNQK